jgi:hypothetical protein
MGCMIKGTVLSRGFLLRGLGKLIHGKKTEVENLVALSLCGTIRCRFVCHNCVLE